MCGRRFMINVHVSNRYMYEQFNKPDHSVLPMNVRNIEKINHSSKISEPLRKDREEFWIRELGTAFPYGCNDRTNSVSNLSSPRCSSLNRKKSFNISQRR